MGIPLIPGCVGGVNGLGRSDFGGSFGGENVGKCEAAKPSLQELGLTSDYSSLSEFEVEIIKTNPKNLQMKSVLIKGISNPTGSNAQFTTGSNEPIANTTGTASSLPSNSAKNTKTKVRKKKLVKPNPPNLIHLVGSKQDLTAAPSAVVIPRSATSVMTVNPVIPPAAEEVNPEKIIAFTPILPKAKLPPLSSIISKPTINSTGSIKLDGFSNRSDNASDIKIKGPGSISINPKGIRIDSKNPSNGSNVNTLNPLGSTLNPVNINDTASFMANPVKHASSSVTAQKSPSPNRPFKAVPRINGNPFEFDSLFSKTSSNLDKPRSNSGDMLSFNSVKSMPISTGGAVNPIVLPADVPCNLVTRPVTNSSNSSNLSANSKNHRADAPVNSVIHLIATPVGVPIINPIATLVGIPVIQPKVNASNADSAVQPSLSASLNTTVTKHTSISPPKPWFKTLPLVALPKVAKAPVSTISKPVSTVSKPVSTVSKAVPVTAKTASISSKAIPTSSKPKTKKQKTKSSTIPSTFSTTPSLTVPRTSNSSTVTTPSTTFKTLDPINKTISLEEHLEILNSHRLDLLSSKANKSYEIGDTIVEWQNTYPKNDDDFNAAVQVGVNNEGGRVRIFATRRVEKGERIKVLGKGLE